MAYIAWLNTAMDQGESSWLLSTESEWEKAARWDAQRGVSRLYPWGNRFDTNRCNTSESGIGATTPVGFYPASDARRSGASPFGVEEMAGSVFEWTGSLNNPYPYGAHDGREVLQSPAYSVMQHVSMYRYIVVRGGSWLSDQRLARAGCRGVDEPSTIDLGFRLVRAVPGS
jgi:formylglycine-generating enzyme required for sulfatase activity